MRKYRLDLYKNKNIFLVAGILIIHLFFSGVFFFHRASFLVIYNLCSALVYVILLLSRKRLFFLLSVTFSRLHSFKTLFPLCPSVSLYSLCQSLELHLSISGRKFCSSSTQLSFFLGLFLISIYPLPQLKVSFIALIL